MHSSLICTGAGPRQTQLQHAFMFSQHRGIKPLFLRRKKMLKIPLGSLPQYDDEAKLLLSDPGELDEEQLQQLPEQIIARVTTTYAFLVRVQPTQHVEGGTGPIPRRELVCSLSTMLLKTQTRIICGDKVEVTSIDWESRKGQVVQCFERESLMVRPPVANVNLVLVVFSMAQPMYSTNQVNRFLVASEASMLPAAVVLNKIDLVPPDEVERRRAQVSSWGYEVFCVSAATGEGIEQVQEFLKDRITVVAGPSGAGKSSIINTMKMLSAKDEVPIEETLVEDQQGDEAATPDAEVQIQRIQEMQNKSKVPVYRKMTIDTGTYEPGPWVEEEFGLDFKSLRSRMSVPEQGMEKTASFKQRAKELETTSKVTKKGLGRHTTRNTKLMPLPGGGLMADTPGFSYPGLEHVDSKLLPLCFPELRQVMEDFPCKYRNCSHVHEPGCGVAVNWERYQLYAQLFLELQEKEQEERSQIYGANKKYKKITQLVKIKKDGRDKRELVLDKNMAKKTRRQQEKQNFQDTDHAARYMEDFDVEEIKGNLR